MLRELRIENIAVIEKTDIRFFPGLNVLTGETGAGKSIILDALSAVTGSRVSRDMIRTGADRAVITAVFDRDGCEEWLKENDLDPEEDSLILQRRITPDGKSVCRIGGVPVAAAQLRGLGERLLEIHGQNDGLRLLDERRHLEALDRYAGLNLTDYSAAFDRLRQLRREQERLTMDEDERLRLQESLRDTVEELDRASLRPGEYEELTSRRDLLRNSEKLTEALTEALNALRGDTGAESMLNEAARNCQRASGYASELTEASDRLTEAGYLLADAAERLLDFQASLNFSPEEYDRLEERIHDLNRLERKYRRTADELPDYLEECRARLDELSFADDRLLKLEKEITSADRDCRTLARKLHEARLNAGKTLSSAVETELHDLSMPSARFLIEVTEQEDLTATGLDSVRFLLSANRGEPPGRLSRIASGGELSRVMLAMKNVLSRSDPVPVLVFDEIDTGVSGIAAQRVGEKLALLAGDRQVLCVTHLPQLASMADSHFVITKTETEGRTSTTVTRLDREGREQELARLHGGDHITETTLRSASEQLTLASRFKAEHRLPAAAESIETEET